MVVGSKNDPARSTMPWFLYGSGYHFEPLYPDSGRRDGWMGGWVDGMGLGMGEGMGGRSEGYKCIWFCTTNKPPGRRDTMILGIFYVHL